MRWKLELMGIVMGIIGMFMGGFIVYITTPDKPKIKACACLTLEQSQVYSQKIDMFVDSIQKAKKQSTAIRLIDSVNHYRRIANSSAYKIKY